MLKSIAAFFSIWISHIDEQPTLDLPLIRFYTRRTSGHAFPPKDLRLWRECGNTAPIPGLMGAGAMYPPRDGSNKEVSRKTGREERQRLISGTEESNFCPATVRMERVGKEGAESSQSNLFCLILTCQRGLF